MSWGNMPSEELYELKADPDNVANLAEQAERLAALRQALAAQMLENRDNGLLPEWCEEEGYEASRRESA